MTPKRRKILVAVDGSQHSLQAVRYVSGCFPPGDTEVHLFTVLNKVPQLFYDLGKEPPFQKSIIEIRADSQHSAGSVSRFYSCISDGTVDQRGRSGSAGNRSPQDRFWRRR